MEKENSNAPEEELKDTDDLETEELDENIDDLEEGEDDNSQGAPKDKTVEELLNEEDKKEDSVPLKSFLAMKKDNKEMARQIKELKEQFEAGTSKEEISDEISALGDKYNVDPKFAKELSDIIFSKAKGEFDEELKNRIKPIEEKEKAKRIDDIFNQEFEKVIGEMSEDWSKVVNKTTIKELSLLPQNAKKTLPQIIEDTYGKAVPEGKATMEPYKPKGGRDTEIDFKKAQEDGEYFDKIMADPELKKKYNEKLEDRIQL